LDSDSDAGEDEDEEDSDNNQLSNQIIEYDTASFYNSQSLSQPSTSKSQQTKKAASNYLRPPTPTTPAQIKDQGMISTLADLVHLTKKRESHRGSYRPPSEASDDHSLASHNTAVTYNTSGTVKHQQQVNIDAVVNALSSLPGHVDHHDVTERSAIRTREPSPMTVPEVDITPSHPPPTTTIELLQQQQQSSANAKQSTGFLSGLFHSLTSHSSDSSHTIESNSHDAASAAVQTDQQSKLFFGRKSKTAASTASDTTPNLPASVDEHIMHIERPPVKEDSQQSIASIMSVNEKLKMKEEVLPQNATHVHVSFAQPAPPSTADQQQHEALPMETTSSSFELRGSVKSDRSTLTSSSSTTGRRVKVIDLRAMNERIEANRNKLQESYRPITIIDSDASADDPSVWDLSNHQLVDASAETIIHAADQHHEKQIQLSKIQTMILRENQLEDFSSLQHLTYSCPKLQSLDLSCNSIKASIPRSMIFHPDHLRKLDLSHNYIEDIANIVIFQCLEYLNLAHNQVARIHSLPSKCLYLDISHNKLSNVIDLRVVGLCQHLRILSIDQNPFCETSDLNRWFPSTSAAAGQPLNLRTIAHSMIPSLEVFNGQLLPKHMMKLLKSTKFSGSQSVSRRRSTAAASYSHLQISKHDQMIKDKQRCFQYRQREENLFEERVDYEQKILAPPVKLSKDQLQDLQHRLSMPTASYDSKLRANNRPSSYHLHNPIKAHPPLTSDGKGSGVTKKWIANPDQLSIQKRMMLRECMRWMDSSRQQLRYAMDAFNAALKLASYDETSSGSSAEDAIAWMMPREELLNTFQRSLQLVGFYPRIIVPSTIDDYISITIGYTDEELDIVEKCREVIDQMTSFGNILHDLRDFMTGNPPSASLVTAIDDQPVSKMSLKESLMNLMLTDDGRFIHDFLLLPNNIDYREILHLPVADYDDGDGMKYDDIYDSHPSSEAAVQVASSIGLDPILSLTIDPTRHHSEIEDSITNSSISMTFDAEAEAEALVQEVDEAAASSSSPRALLPRLEVDKYVNDVKNRINGRFLNTLIEEMSQNGTPLATSLPENHDDLAFSSIDMIIESASPRSKSKSANPTPSPVKQSTISSDGGGSGKNHHLSMFFRPSANMSRKSASRSNSEQNLQMIMNQDVNTADAMTDESKSSQSPDLSTLPPKSPIKHIQTNLDDSLEIPKSVVKAVESIEKRISPRGVTPTIAVASTSTSSTGASMTSSSETIAKRISPKGVTPTASASSSMITAGASATSSSEITSRISPKGVTPTNATIAESTSTSSTTTKETTVVAAPAESSSAPSAETGMSARDRIRARMEAIKSQQKTIE
jgi:hypothetical protein